MKKILAMLLAMAMAFSLAACGGKKGADDIPDTMTSKDGKYEVAFVTDVGQLKDKSFNQGTWDGVKLYASEHSLSYKYYQPANGDNATDDDRYNAMKQAAEGEGHRMRRLPPGGRPGQGRRGVPRRPLRVHRQQPPRGGF